MCYLKASFACPTLLIEITKELKMSDHFEAVGLVAVSVAAASFEA